MTEKDLPPPPSVGPIDPTEFKFFWQAVAAYKAGKLPGVQSSVGEVLDLGKGRQIRFLNSPIIQALDAVMSVIRGDKKAPLTDLEKEKAASVAMRMVELTRLIKARALDQFIKRTEDGTLLPDFLLDVAAEIPCSPSGFNKKRFLNAVKKKLVSKKKKKVEKAN